MARKPLRQVHRVKVAIDRQAAAAWAAAARRKRCVVCGAKEPQGHHIVWQQQLRRQATWLGVEFERLRWDRRNLLPLCEGCHGANHARSRPVTLEELRAHAPKVFQFARELGLLPWLERTYPPAGNSRTSDRRNV